MEYAMEAGIDYFAYVWYRYDGLKNGREFHVQSQYREQVKICACLDDNAIGNPVDRAELEALIGESYYNHPETASAMMANTVIVYGWNEHDEGGWICPTIEVDANGNQLFHEDGTPKINDSHLQAAKSAIDQYKNGTLPALTINGVTHKAQAPEAETEEAAAETISETEADTISETVAEPVTDSSDQSADDDGGPRVWLAIGIGCGACRSSRGCGFALEKEAEKGRVTALKKWKTEPKA